MKPTLKTIDLFGPIDTSPMTMNSDRHSNLEAVLVEFPWSVITNLVMGKLFLAWFLMRGCRSLLRLFPLSRVRREPGGHLAAVLWRLRAILNNPSRARG